MSVNDLAAFLRFAAKHPELHARLSRPISYEDFVAIATERGYDLGSLKPAEIKRAVEKPLRTFCNSWPE